MKTRKDRPQHSIWFWFAAALIPEAAAFQVESPRAMAQRIELLRASQAGNDSTRDDELEGRLTCGQQSA